MLILFKPFTSVYGLLPLGRSWASVYDVWPLPVPAQFHLAMVKDEKRASVTAKARIDPEMLQFLRAEGKFVYG
jgi:hypothetical protein